MRRSMILTLVLLSPSLAAAEENDDVSPGREIDREPNTYIAAGAISGSDHFEYGGFALEGGTRLGDLRGTPLFVRAMGHFGTTKTADNPGRGTYVEARTGIEGRSCTRTGLLCASVGVDVGLHRGRYEQVPVDNVADAKPTDAMTDEHFERFDSLVVAPRLTLDAGNRVRVRGVVERPYHLVDGKGVPGLAGTLSLGIGF